MGGDQNTATEIFNNIGSNDIINATKSAKPSILKEVGDVLNGNIGDPFSNIMGQVSSIKEIETLNAVIGKPIVAEVPKTSGLPDGNLAPIQIGGRGVKD